MELSDGLSGLLLHEKPAGILLGLKGSSGKYASVLAKETNCTYTHILKVLNQLRDFDIVKFKKQGRTKTIELTEKGIDIAHELEGLVRQLEKASEDKKNIWPETEGQK
jgi:predicted transcriptional regulator